MLEGLEMGLKGGEGAGVPEVDLEVPSSSAMPAVRDLEVVVRRRGGS